MKLIILPKAKKQLSKLPKSDQAKVVRKLTYLEAGLVTGKPLKGDFEDYFSVRAWPYRILYTVKSDTVIIQVIRHRQGVYK